MEELTYALMNRYNSNEQVPVTDFVTTANTLLGKMLTAKEGIESRPPENGYACLLAAFDSKRRTVYGRQEKLSA